MKFHDPSDFVSVRLEHVLQNAASAFSARDFETVAQHVETPTSVYIFDSMLMVRDIALAQHFLSIYFLNLRRMGMETTETEVIKVHVDKLPNYKALVRTRHKKADGSTLSSFDYTIFGTFGPNGEISINMLEVIGEPDPDVIKGLPLI